jgi:hypothetical protein
MLEDKMSIEAMKQAPVAWLYWDSWGTMKLSQIMPPPVGAFPVYTTPPAAQSQWVGLTDEEIDEWTPEIHSVIQAIEAKLKEKNT